MKMRCLLVAIGLLVTPLTAWAEDAALEQRMKKLEDEVRQYKEELRTYQEQERRGSSAERRMEQKELAPGSQYPTATGPMTDVRVERAGEETIPLSFGATGSGRLVYAKPFVAAPKLSSAAIWLSNIEHKARRA